MTATFDVIAIGTGSAASAVVSRCRDAGWTVAIVDYRPFGGTCALRGCDPKKMLVAGAEVIDAIHRMHKRGVEVQSARINWQQLIAFKRTFTAPIPQKREQYYAQNGIDAFHGRARFCNPQSIEVDGQLLEA